jgi:pimeloyl-ACP methyl ester carboxylesterase
MGRRKMAGVCLLAVMVMLPAFGFAAGPPSAPGPVAAPPATALEGAWQGTLSVGAVRLRLVIKIKHDGARKGPGAEWTATLDSIDQGARDIPIDAVTVEGDRLKLALAKIGASYDARLEGQRLVGTFKQNGAVLPLDLEKTASPSVIKPRPQEPRRPFPYKEIALTVDNAAGGNTLGCTLTEPRQKGPFAAVVLFTGSGPQDRDESLMGHKPFLVLSDAITRQGVAVLRCDDRGVGKSTGTFANATTLDFAGDALAEVAALRARPEIARAHVGVAGHSEGAAVAAIAAGRSKDVAFIVLLAGTALPGGEILDLQRAWLEKQDGLTEASIADSRANWHRAYAIIKAEKDDAAARKKLRVLYDGLPTATRASMEQAGGFEAAVKVVLSPWCRTFLTLDPRTYLAQVKVPVLAINGDLDRQVPARENIPAMKKALAHDHDVTVREMPGLNHLFQHAKTGALTEYGELEETMSPEVLTLVSNWIARHGE